MIGMHKSAKCSRQTRLSGRANPDWARPSGRRRLLWKIQRSSATLRYLCGVLPALQVYPLPLTTHWSLGTAHLGTGPDCHCSWLPTGFWLLVAVYWLLVAGYCCHCHYLDAGRHLPGDLNYDQTWLPRAKARLLKFYTTLSACSITIVNPSHHTRAVASSWDCCSECEGALYPQHPLHNIRARIHIHPSIHPSIHSSIHP